MRAPQPSSTRTTDTCYHFLCGYWEQNLTFPRERAWQRNRLAPAQPWLYSGCSSTPGRGRNHQLICLLSLHIDFFHLYHDYFKWLSANPTLGLCNSLFVLMGLSFSSGSHFSICLSGQLLQLCCHNVEVMSVLIFRYIVTTCGSEIVQVRISLFETFQTVVEDGSTTSVLSACRLLVGTSTLSSHSSSVTPHPHSVSL